MVTVTLPPVRTARRTTLFAELGDAPVLGHVGPNWFASVMGTGIVAVALVSLPFDVPGAAAVAEAFWLLAATLLVVIGAATLLHHRQHPEAARGHRTHPVMMHFYGAPAMALMTVGAGALLVGQPVLGAQAALALDVVLWTLGTALGLLTTVLVPLRMVTTRALGIDAAYGGWLMPVVPPMVSAATGALLVPHVPAGAPRTMLLVACFLFFVLSLVAGAVVIGLVVRRLGRHGVGPAATVPTLWIVLGPLGQSVTAAHHLDALAPSGLALTYGVPVGALALLWLVFAATVTLRTARRHLPFSMTWWSFTFPVGTLVTGTSGLAALTGSLALQVLAGALLVVLLAAWMVVAVRTTRGVWSGRLLRAPAPA